MSGFSWESIAETVGKYAPLVGTLLGGPAGATVGAMVASALGTEATPSAVSQALQTNPEAAVKLAQIESDERVKLQELATEQAKSEMAAAVATASDVNKTMQSEAASEHWPTYTWRPAIGFAVAFNTISAAILVLAVYGAVVFGAPQGTVAMGSLPMVLGALAAISATVMPILGIASYFRGKAQADPSIPTNNRG
jgi:roadblock/LC7 domain-containing protein